MRYDVFVRTTLTLEPDVALKLKKRMAARKLTLKAAVNQALRDGLKTDDAQARVHFRVEPHAFKFKAGIDLHKLNQLTDELEAEEFSQKLHR
jgi:hypothetical protein